MKYLATFVAVIFPSAAAEFAGPASCRPCHPAQFKMQAESRHARALRPIQETPLAALLSQQPLQERSGVSFAYQPVENGVLVNVIQGNRRASALLEWVFGSGAQAYTPVGRLDGRFLEHRISYYIAAQGGRRTLGHPGAPSRDPKSALGLLQDPETAYRCFNCHGTGVKPGPDLTAMLPGVTCERCHGAGGGHITGKEAMPRASQYNRDNITELCGACHRLPSSKAIRTPELDDPLSIRFAPVGLTASVCYRQSPKLSCVTCHDPHQDVSHDSSAYIRQCIACHPQQTKCPKETGRNCLTCHMQRRSPAPYLAFTDHRIRVYKE